jgi:pimeloyl-ACP methyl ester carboxylesterase
MNGDRVAGLLSDPRRIVRAAVRRSPQSSFEQRLAWDALDRPHYAYGTLQAARLAKALGHDAVTVIELGVAGGNGLVLLERFAAEVSELVGIRVDTVGFDAGAGMPPPVDYRDLPYVWRPGMFTMDEPALRRRLSTARLVIGDVSVTVPDFVRAGCYAPVGFVAFDLDYWSSTAASMCLLDAPQPLRLPRVFCYFDDIVGDDWEIHCPYVGELLAIEEFNAAHGSIKVCPLPRLRHARRIPAPWNDQVYVCHDLSHPQYTANVHPGDWDLALKVPTARAGGTP